MTRSGLHDAIHPTYPCLQVSSESLHSDPKTHDRLVSNPLILASSGILLNRTPEICKVTRSLECFVAVSASARIAQWTKKLR